jgi:Zn-dependent protease
VQAATLSLLLCFFNLIPIPPLDGSHILRIATGMTWETYTNFARFGFIIVIIVLQVPFVRIALSNAVYGTLGLLGNIFGVT